MTLASLLLLAGCALAAPRPSKTDPTALGDSIPTGIPDTPSGLGGASLPTDAPGIISLLSGLGGGGDLTALTSLLGGFGGGSLPTGIPDIISLLGGLGGGSGVTAAVQPTGISLAGNAAGTGAGASHHHHRGNRTHVSGVAGATGRTRTGTGTSRTGALGAGRTRSATAAPSAAASSVAASSVPGAIPTLTNTEIVSTVTAARVAVASSAADASAPRVSAPRVSGVISYPHSSNRTHTGGFGTGAGRPTRSAGSGRAGSATGRPTRSETRSGARLTSLTSSTAAAAVNSAADSPFPATVSATSAGPSATAAASNSSGTSVKYGGVNLAGFDFGCTTDGTCNTANTLDIVKKGTATQQLTHFVNNDGLNAFRLPVGWQYLVNNQLGGTLDATNFANYDALVQGCLNSGASLCIIDIHNYARYNGNLIGSSNGPTNAQFANLWSQLATKYSNASKVAFGIMNEPHDLTITTWAASAQSAVTAIRNAGATSQMILLPGTDYTSAGSFATNSGPYLLNVTNPDGSTDNIIFDVHKYLDSDNSGTHTECVSDNIQSAFSPLATWLRTNKRQAMLTETGGGETTSCLQDVCSMTAFLNQNSDVYLGYLGWGAGGFDQTYELVLTPVFNSNGTVTDQKLLTQCFVGAFKGNGTGSSTAARTRSIKAPRLDWMKRRF